MGSVGTYGWWSSLVLSAVVRIPVHWLVLFTRRSRALGRFRYRTNFGLWLVVGQRREKTGPDKLIVLLIVQMTFEFESTHLHIQSFLLQFYIHPSSKEDDSCFLMMTLQMWLFPYQVILHLVSKHSVTQRTKCLQEPSPLPFAVLQNSVHWQELTT